MTSVLADNYQLKWHSHGTYLHTSVASLQRSESFTDVTLATAEGHYIPAHRFILSACSTFFQQLLQISTSSHQLVIVLPSEINYRTLITLLQYMYSGEATVSNDLLNGVLKAGETLKVKGLCMGDRDKYGKTNTTENNKDDFLKLQTQRKPSVPLKTYKAPEKNSQQKQQSQQNLSQASVATGSAKSTNETNGVKTEPGVNGTKKSSSLINEKISKYMECIDTVQIKEEPADWEENEEREMIDMQDMIETQMIVQPEMYGTMEDDIEEEVADDDNFYAPLTCDLCQETFKTPALWVRHVETHPTSDLPQRKRRRGDADDEEDGEFPPLRCELCQEVYKDPADWVKHIQATHTEEQLALSNNKDKSKEKSSRQSSRSTLAIATSSSAKSSNENHPIQKKARVTGSCNKFCPICNKSFPSSASMLIHARTHTGERPYLCKVCMKGFNVKSNLLRHLKTVHESMFSSALQATADHI